VVRFPTARAVLAVRDHTAALPGLGSPRRGVRGSWLVTPFRRVDKIRLTAALCRPRTNAKSWGSGPCPTPTISPAEHHPTLRTTGPDLDRARSHDPCPGADPYRGGQRHPRYRDEPDPRPKMRCIQSLDAARSHRPHWVGRDRFVLSVDSSPTCISSCSCRLRTGTGPHRALRTLGLAHPGPPLVPAHPRWVEMTTGPLGHGAGVRGGHGGWRPGARRGLFDPDAELGTIPFATTSTCSRPTRHRGMRHCPRLRRSPGTQRLGPLVVVYDQTTSRSRTTPHRAVRGQRQALCGSGWHVQHVEGGENVAVFSRRDRSR